MTAPDFHPDYAGIIAKAICHDLKEHVEAIEIVGGVRRKLKRVLGATIVYISKAEREVTEEKQGDLFGGFNKTRSVKQSYIVERILPELYYLEYRKNEDGELVSPVKHPFRMKAMINPPTGVPIDLYPVKSSFEWGVALTMKTGPANFAEKMVRAAEQKGYKCEGFRLSMLKDNSPVPATTEEAFFELCGMEWIDPEKRR